MESIRLRLRAGVVARAGAVAFAEFSHERANDLRVGFFRAKDPRLVDCAVSCFLHPNKKLKSDTNMRCTQQCVYV